MRSPRSNKVSGILLWTTCCALLIPALAGCASTSTDLSVIEIGTPREAVETVLGQPVKSVTTAAGRIDTYEYTAAVSHPAPRFESGHRKGERRGASCRVAALFALEVVEVKQANARSGILAGSDR